MRQHIPDNDRQQASRHVHSVMLLIPEELNAFQEWSTRTVTDRTRIWTDRYMLVVTFRRRGSGDIWSIDESYMYRPAWRRVCVREECELSTRSRRKPFLWSQRRHRSFTAKLN